MGPLVSLLLHPSSLQLSSALLPATNFTCTQDSFHLLSQVMKVYQTLQDASIKVGVIAQTTVTPDYRCAWVNNRALNNCSTIPAPQAQHPLVMALEEANQCSNIGANYNLCSNV